MKKISIIGTSGHAAELREYIPYHYLHKPAESIDVVGFIDEKDDSYRHYGFKEPFLGPIHGHPVRKDVEYLMGIANLKYRRMVVEDLKKDGAKFTGFIHPTALDLSRLN